jgi:tetratricopeptide (TPR) repeat protein
MQVTAGGNPDSNLARFIQSGQLAEAMAECRRRLEIVPGHAETLDTLGNLLDELGRPAEAEAAYRQAIEAQPHFAAAHYNLGLLLQGQRRLEEAATAYDQALALRPGLFLAHNNRGAALRDLGRLDEAMTAFETAVRLQPDYADAQFNQSMCRLLMGDFDKGWAQYEWRWRIRQAEAARRSFAAALWLGQEDLVGRTILLHAEQGLGDTLQFCRYAPKVAALGANVILEVQPGLERLLSNIEGVRQIVTRGAALPSFDFHTPLMSLPLALNALPDAVPVPYLKAEKDLTADWAGRLGRSEGIRVGLCWAGAARPDQPIASATDKRRSLPLEAFRPLADVKNAQFLSLQKGSAADQLLQARQGGWSGPSILDFTSELHDFADTAALVAHLDLVITCDTSVAHLAGGMGKPVWILNRFDGCWRWLADRDDSPWYPSARIYRQAAPGHWTSVIDCVVADLNRNRGC